MKVLSLFDGMSCGQLALQKAKVFVKTYYASEIDPNAIKVTQHNFPNTIQVGNVCLLGGEQFPKIDLLIGGSPCQSFSFAGKLKGMVTEEDREVLFLEQYLDLKEKGFQFQGESYLFWEYVRLKEQLQPKYFLLENVRMKDHWKKVITRALGVEPIEINSSLVSAQNRKRLYWTNIPVEKVPEDKGLALKDILEKEVDSKYDITERFYKKKGGTLSFKKSRGNIRSVDQKSKTLTTGGHGISNSGSTNIWFDENFIRIPTPMEYERLQTVPDGYTDVGIRDSHRYKMLGNGWTVDVIAHIFSFLDKNYFFS